MVMKDKGKQIAGKSPAGTSSGKRRKSVAEGSSDRKKRRPGVLQFFDDAAVDADLDDEEELDDDESDLEEEEFDLDFGNEQSKPEKGTGKATSIPFYLKEEELSGDELEELIRDRYGRGSEHIVYDEDKECDDRVLAEHSFEDATIWKVKCMFGKEQQVTFCFMQKYVDLKDLGTTMGIFSVFALEHIKGYVFIEADKSSDVIEACRGFCNIYSTRVGPVPRSEIPHLLSVRNKVCEVSKGTWVRMKNGNYKGDLGQVVAVDEERKRATIKMVPRIDLEAIAKKFGGGISLKRSAVPAPRLISTHELEHFRPHIEIRRDRMTGEVYEVLDGLMLKDGYLYKKMAIVSLVYWGVQPSEHELLKFTDSNKDEDGDVDWLSSVYKGRKMMKSTQASRDKGDAKEGNGYDLHELVLFGQKDFGVIIALGKDGIQILKGNTEGQQVVTVKTQVIKSCCEDKMFTAADCHMKTISINDLVKVVEGPMEDRQGIVRHMYKGTLFLYDENQVDNSGIFHVKSKLCENTKQLKGSKGKSGNKGDKASSSFIQSSMGTCDQEDNSRTNAGRYQQRESNQAFSIGQTLRIRKGPLKGYLCRVVGVYRTHVTVKLDSLVKVITVEEQFLSVPNIRSDCSTAVPIGVLSEEGREQPLGQSSWDAGRDSWQALTTSASPFSNKDQKADQERGDPWGSCATKDQEKGDPWGSKLQSETKDEEQGDPWGSKLPLATEDQKQGDADPWGSSKLAPVAEEDPWGSKLQLTNKDQEQGDSWGSKLPLATIDKTKGDADAWGSSSKLGPVVEDKTKGDADAWGSSSKLGPVVEAQEQRTKSADPWGCKLSSAYKADQGGAADPWGSKAVASATIDQGQGDAWSDKGKSRAQEQSANDPWSSKLAVATREQGRGDAWNNNTVSGEKAEFIPQAAGREKDIDVWDKPSVKSTPVIGGWENVKQHNADDGENWAGKSINAEKAATFGNSSSQSHLEADAWDIKGKGVVNNEVPWGKAAESKEKDSGEFGQWGKSVDGSSERKTLSSTAAHGSWDAASESLTKSSVENGGNTSSSWEKVKVPSSCQSDQWGQCTTNATESGDWGKTDFSSQKAVGGDQVSSWNKVDNEKSGGNDQWNKPSNFEGGSGRGRGRNAWDGGSGRGSGRDTRWSGSDGPGGSQDQENSWSGQKDFQGGRGFGRGRGRGRYEGRGNRDEHQERSYDSGGGRGSGRGRDGGRKGDWGSGRSNDFDDTGSFGRGRGRGRGRFDSSDWKNNQENFGDGGFSKGSSSGWGNDGSSWDKSKGTTRNEPTTGNNGQQGGWLGRNSSSQDHSSDWNTPKPSTWNQVSSGNDRGGWDDKLETPTSVGKQSSGWNSSEGKSWEHKAASNEGVGKEAGRNDASGAGSNWNSKKPFNTTQFSDWNSTAKDPIFAGTKSVGAAVEDKKPSTWNKVSSGNHGGGWDNKLETPTSVGKQSSGWSSSEGKSWEQKPVNTTQFSDWNSTTKDPIFAGTKSVGASAGGDDWSKAKPSSGPGGEPSGWKQNSTSELVKEDGNSGGNNWSRPKTFSGGNQSSGWGNDDDGKTWNKPNSFDADQSGGWGRGRNPGRGDSFTNRGRGRGRSFGGGGWNGGRGANQEDSGSDGKQGLLPTPKPFGGGQSSSNWSKDSGKEQSGWGAGETGNDRKTESGSQPTGWTKQESKWNESSTVDGSCGSGGGSWDQPKLSGNNGGAGWNTTGKTNEAGPSGDHGTGWEKAAGSGGNAKDGGW